MFRYRLRTLLVVLAVGPMVLAGCYFAVIELLADDDLDPFRHPVSGIYIEVYRSPSQEESSPP